jgi:outer membrane lipoprotein-sorting protein
LAAAQPIDLEESDVMKASTAIGFGLALALAALAAGAAGAQQPGAKGAPGTAAPAPQPGIEPAAVTILKTMSEKLAAAKTMRFTAVSTYESPAINCQPLYYTTVSQVTLERPDKLRVITPGDGPPTEFYYDGKTMAAYDPAMNLAAVADAPAAIDAMVKAAYDKAAIYFPFVDFIVADPYKDMEGSLKSAIASDTVQAELWIGVADKLPRMIRVVYPKDPAKKALRDRVFRLAPQWPGRSKRLRLGPRAKSAAHGLQEPR